MRCSRRPAFASRPAREWKNVQNTDSGVRFNVDAGQREDRNGRGRSAAGRRGPQAQHRKHRARRHARRARPRLRQSRRMQRTGEPGVYAIGDIVAGHAAAGARRHRRRHGRHRAHRRQSRSRPINKNRIPSCTYTEPGIGSVGFTEAQARAAGYKVKIGKFPFAGQQQGDASWASTTAS